MTTLEPGYPVAPPDPLEASIRYTSLAAVKKQLGITDSVWDVEATTAIITVETMIDQYVGGTFPDGAIPEAVRQAAYAGGIEVFKLAGLSSTGGRDDNGFLGIVDPASAARAAFNVIRPTLYGLRISWGLS